MVTKSLSLTGRLRVTHVVNSLEVGGLERLVHDLALERGAECTSVVCLNKLGAFGEDLQASGVDVSVIGLEGSPLRVIAQLCRQLRRLRPDIVHCHNMRSYLIGGLAARLCGRRGLVLTKHGSAPLKPRSAAGLTRWLMRRTTVVVVSPQIEGLMKGSRPQRLVYIPNGIPLSAYDRRPPRLEARQRLGWSPAGPWLGIVARLHPGKNHLTLLESLRAVRRRFPTTCLAIVGDGPHRGVIQEAIDRLNFEGAVAMLGERRDIAEILAALDLFVLASETEGMPMTLLEAMAARLPVVATRVGGVPEVVLDGQTGLLVPPRSPEALSAAIETVLSDPVMAEQFGQAGRRRVEDLFDLRRTVSRYEETYLTVVGRAPGPV
ncbi:MAG: glycosyltransferase [Isosphaeraceae bacterium]